MESSARSQKKFTQTARKFFQLCMFRAEEISRKLSSPLHLSLTQKQPLPPAKEKTTLSGRGRRGFSLMETAISIALFGITLLSTIAVISHMHVLQESARNLATASLHAQTILEAILLQTDSSLSQATTVDWTGWATNNGCDTLSNEVASVTFTNVGSQLTEISVTINWLSRDHPMSYQLMTRAVAT